MTIKTPPISTLTSLFITNMESLIYSHLSRRIKIYYIVLYAIFPAVMLGFALSVTCLSEHTTAELDLESYTLYFEAETTPEQEREKQICLGYQDLNFSFDFYIANCTYHEDISIAYALDYNIDISIELPQECKNPATQALLRESKEISFAIFFESLDGKLTGTVETYLKKYFDYTQCIIDPVLIMGYYTPGAGFFYIDGYSSECKMNLNNVKATITIVTAQLQTSFEAVGSVSSFKNENIGPYILGNDGLLHFNCTAYIISDPATSPGYVKCTTILRLIAASGIFYAEVTLTSERNSIQQSLSTVVTNGYAWDDTYKCHSKANLQIDGSTYIVTLIKNPTIEQCHVNSNGVEEMFTINILIRNYAMLGLETPFKARMNFSNIDPGKQSIYLWNTMSDNFPSEAKDNVNFVRANNYTGRFTLFAFDDRKAATPNITMMGFTITKNCHAKAFGNVYNDETCILVNSTCAETSTKLRLEIYDLLLSRLIVKSEYLGEFPNGDSTYCFSVNSRTLNVEKIEGIMWVEDYAIAIEAFENYIVSDIPYIGALIGGLCALAAVYYVLIFIFAGK